MAALQGSIIVLHKKIAELECPRDDSLDNSIVVWYSQAFTINAGSGGNSISAANGSGLSDDPLSASMSSGSDSSVPTICSLIEDMGMTVKRCSDPEEAISKARELQSDGLLRCVIVGGDERGMSCGSSCVKQHTDQPCLRCGELWEAHSSHECHIGGRGTFSLDKPDEGHSEKKKVTSLQIMKTLTDTESAYARTKKMLPYLRTAVYSAHVNMKEEERMDFWKLGTTVTDDSKQLLSWVKSMPNWNEDVCESNYVDEGDTTSAVVRPCLKRIVSSNEKADLIKYKEELEVLEERKTAAAEDDEAVRKILLQQVTEKHSQLDISVQRRIAELMIVEQIYKRLLEECSVTESDVLAEIKLQHVGPHSGREAALAMGWLDVNADRLHKLSDEANAVDKAQLCKHSVSVSNELMFIKQMALAAKVVAHVTSPMHKKLLNLCHNWLR